MCVRENGVCVCVSGRARRACVSVCQFSEVMNESGCVCKLYCKVSETKKYPACQESVAASFRLRSDL